MDMLRLIVIIFTFLLGLTIFLYPIVSHWRKTKEHYSIIRDYNDLIHQMSEEEKLNEWRKAEKYNENLSESSILMEDPFGAGETEDHPSSYYNVLNIGETIGHLEIPKIDVSLPIFHGISDEVLQQGVGHMSNSSFPIGGKGSHTALTAHRGLPSTKLFRDLDQLEEDDLIYLKTLGETLTYKVDDIRIVLPSETSWLSIQEDKDYVTLITCEPYMINTHRLLVRGKRIPARETAQVKAPEAPGKNIAEKMNQTSLTNPQGEKAAQKEENSKRSKIAMGAMFVIVIGYFIRKRLVKSDNP